MVVQEEEFTVGNAGAKKQLLRRGRRFVGHFEPGEIGLELSAKVCSMGFEGVVSKSPR